VGLLHRRRRPKDASLNLIEATGLTIEATRLNPCEFLSTPARNASTTCEVQSISVLAVKPGR